MSEVTSIISPEGQEIIDKMLSEAEGVEENEC